MEGKTDVEVSWKRVNYPLSGKRVKHQHGPDGSVEHTHVAGNLPHSHLHRKLGKNRFEDVFTPGSGASK